MTLTIRVENPLTDDCRWLIEGSERALREVYPPEECFSFSPDELATPNTEFFVARVNGKPVGCVALVDQIGYGEIKRLFVCPEGRGLGIARKLMHTLETAAKDIGLGIIRLESGEELKGAMHLYRDMGYQDCAAFGNYPDIASNVFLEKQFRIAAH